MISHNIVHAVLNHYSLAHARASSAPAPAPARAISISKMPPPRAASPAAPFGYKKDGTPRLSAAGRRPAA